MLFVEFEFLFCHITNSQTVGFFKPFFACCVVYTGSVFIDPNLTHVNTPSNGLAEGLL